MVRKLPTNSPTGQQAGFTLIELMIVIAVLAAVLVLAAPGYQTLIQNNRMVSEVYALRAVLSNARSEALARRAPVVVCPTNNGTACVATDEWQDGYMSFVDSNDDTAPDASDPDEEVIQYQQRDLIEEMSIVFSNGADRVRFNPQGHALGSEGTFTICDGRGAEDARALILSPVGSLRSAIETDSPEDGIVNVGGANVTCP